MLQTRSKNGGQSEWTAWRPATGISWRPGEKKALLVILEEGITEVTIRSATVRGAKAQYRVIPHM